MPNSFDQQRRLFLRRASVFAGVAASLTTLPSLASIAPSAPASPRQLRFVHTHTGEKMTVSYFDGVNYDLSSLLKVNHLLRDFRTGDEHIMDAGLLDILYDLQTLADYDSTFEIISGYRSPITNAALHERSSGVATHSQHMLGKAIDVRLTGFSTKKLGEYARSLERGGVGFYAKSDFVHVDTGRVRFW
jgi:uncharacterized protein YcbK (DUF882 family)